MVDDLFDGWRVFNIFFAGALLLRLLMLRRRRWKLLYTDRDRMNWHAFVGTSVAFLIGSGENIAQNNPPGARTVLTTLALIAIFWTTMLPLNGTRPIQRVKHDEGMRGKGLRSDSSNEDHSRE